MTSEPAVDVAQIWWDPPMGEGLLASGRPLDNQSLLHVPGRSGLAGHYQGEEAIRGVLQTMADLTDGTLKIVPTAVLTATDQTAAVILGRTSATRRGIRLETDTIHILTLRDGTIREMWMFHQNQDHFDTFWST